MSDAEVACRQLGYPTVVGYGTFYGQGMGRIWLANIKCLGTEPKLTNCSFAEWGSIPCNHDRDIGISCTKGIVHIDLKLIDNT